MNDIPRGSVARVGFLCPVDGLNDDEYWNYLADGVGWYIARYSAGLAEETLDDEAIAAYADPVHVRRAASLLLAVKPHVVALADVAAGVHGGHAGDRAMRNAVEAVVDVPVASGLWALTAAVAAVGVKRVAVVTPYPGDLGARLSASLQEAGLVVLSLQNEEERDEFGIGLSSSARWERQAMAADRADADAIVIAGGGVRVAGCLDVLETRLRKPVIASPAALVWLAQRLAGVDCTRSGFGTLFKDFGRADIAPSD